MSLKHFAIAMMTALIVLSASFASPARGEEEFEPFTIVFDIDFRLDDYGIFMSNTDSQIESSWVSGVGWVMTNTATSGSARSYAWYIDAPQFRVDDGSAIRSGYLDNVFMTVNWVASDTAFASSLLLRRANQTGTNVSGGSWSVNTSFSGELEYSTEIRESFGSFNQRLGRVVGNGSINHSSSLTLERIRVTGDCNAEAYCLGLDIQPPQPETPELTRPLRTADTDELRMAHFNLQAVSTAQGQLVHSPVTGTVTQIRPMTNADCATLGVDSSLPPAVTQFLGGGCSVGGAIPSYFSTSNASMVRITQSGTGDVFDLFVAQPGLYSPITVGSAVQAGCPIGGTIRLTIGEVGFLAERGGIALIRSDDVDVSDIIEGDEPDSSGCALDVQYDGCIIGSAIAQDDWTLDRPASRWITTDGQTSAAIAPNSWMRTTLNVDDTRDPRLIIYYLSNDSRNIDANFDVRYGDQTYNVQSPRSASVQNRSIDLSGAQPDVGGVFYTLQITNRSPSSLFISFVCLYLDNAPPRGQCYFVNFDFTQGLDGWSTSDPGVVASGVGSVLIPSGEYIGQQLAMSDEDDGFLTIDWGVRDYENNIYEGNYSVELHYRFGDNWAAEFNQVSRQWIQDRGNMLISEFVLLPLEPIDAPLEIRIDISQEANATLLGEIRSVCLSSETLLTPPRGRIDRTCGVTIAHPAGSDLGLWTQYLWLQFEYFFFCDLIPLLNSWFDATVEFFNTATLFFRWMIVSFNIVMAWLSTDVLFWANGHFSNIAGGNVTFIEVTGGGQSCNNLWCALDGLFGGASSIFDSIATVIVSAIESVIAPILDFIFLLIGTVVDFLFDVIRAILDLIIYIVRQVVDLIALALGLLWSLVAGIGDADPVQINGLPYCNADPNSSPFCRIVWLMDNTIFTGVGVAIVPLLTAYIAILMILWVMKEVKQMATNANRSL